MLLAKELSWRNTGNADTGRHASGAVVVWLAVDGEHDEVLVQATSGVSEVEAVDAAITRSAGETTRPPLMSRGHVRPSPGSQPAGTRHIADATSTDV